MKQLSCSENSAAFTPAMVTALSVTVAEVKFVTVTLVAMVCKPICWGWKLMLEGDNATPGSKMSRFESASGTATASPAPLAKFPITAL